MVTQHGQIVIITLKAEFSERTSLFSFPSFVNSLTQHSFCYKSRRFLSPFLQGIPNIRFPEDTITSSKCRCS
jgi:hypothetical protein